MSRKKQEISEQAEVVLEPDAERIAAMNDYARRIYAGQSPDMPAKLRLERIKLGLIGQGFEDLLDHVEFEC